MFNVAHVMFPLLNLLALEEDVKRTINLDLVDGEGNIYINC